MKREKRRVISLVLALIMLVGLYPSALFQAYANCNLKLTGADKLTGNQAADIVSVAKANLSKTGAQLGATEHWCTDFIYNCARLANIGEDIIPTAGRVSTMHDLLLANGAKEVKTPQAGDIVFYGPSHAAIMSDSVYAYQGNFSGKGSGQAFWTSSKVVYCKYTSATNYAQYGATFVRPNYKKALATVPTPVSNTLTVNYSADGGSITSDKYCLQSDLITLKTGGTYNDVWTYNEAKSWGLTNAASFGLYKTGSHFVGWLNKAGTLLGEDDATLTPLIIEPEVKNKSCTTLLSASWVLNNLTIHYNANGGIISGSTKYKLDEATGDIYKLTNSKLVGVVWAYNNTPSTGLYNNSTFSLKRDGYKFLGWSTQKNSGRVIDQDDNTIKPSDLCRDVEKADAEVTMYACWEMLHTHTMVKDAAIEPTCTEAGRTEGAHCSSCEFVQTPCEEVPTLGHNYASQEAVVVKPTCTKEGRSAILCTRCSNEIQPGVIAATGHSYAEKVNSRATFEEDGSYSNICANCGKVKKTYQVTKIASAVLSKTEYLYNGKKRKPSVTVTDASGKKLTEGTDYTVKYSSSESKMPNKYNVKITFKGRYKGSVKLYYSIRPAMPKNVTAKSYYPGAVIIRYSEIAGATGYEIFYSTSKTGTYKKLGTSKTLDLTSTKFRSGKTIWFKVRAYKYSGGERIYSSFSKAASGIIK